MSYLRCSKLFRFTASDPCLEVYCGAGRMCVADDDYVAQCVCVNTCENEHDRRRRVSVCMVVLKEDCGLCLGKIWA